MLIFPEPYSAPPPARERAVWISSYAGENVSIDVVKLQTWNNIFCLNIIRVFVNPTVYVRWDVLAANHGSLFAVVVDMLLVLLHTRLVGLAPDLVRNCSGL